MFTNDGCLPTAVLAQDECERSGELDVLSVIMIRSE